MCFECLGFEYVDRRIDELPEWGCADAPTDWHREAESHFLDG